MTGELRIPEELTWLRGMAGGPQWLAELPDRVATCAQRWSLCVGPPFGYGMTSLVVPADLLDGTRAVLKVQFPDPESEHEATALRCWDGDGAVRLLAHDPDLRALLVERCDPGTPLRTLPLDDALDVVVALLPRLWTPPGPAAGGVERAIGWPFTSLAEEVAGWTVRLPVAWERAGRPFERRLVDAALDLLTGLAGSQGEQVLVNQDLHAANVLRAEREPWLVIDPKPLVGEREFSVVPMVRGTELGHSPAAVRRRLDRLSGELGLDRDRVRGWTIGQTMAWSIAPDHVYTSHLDVVRWLLD
ncbi:aminoglycoside phosphotransferase family protein [Micromonospora sp. WMMD1082]|uniref:aminoglycoside phosphotransferase family protein n=1 Tax=Micromonospora sp. WMMD1082 TaxID=3016104 RepID=UPI002417C805|nr:aminoglycoside phosphotransferase family protein [Micromonospora sp. WMMD1082]MDG4793742.1 aminoglycoside phosphotransferase family protein [Micromonospora sp. WMMD1082]